MKRNYSCATLAGFILLSLLCCLGGFFYWLKAPEINASILEWQTGQRLNDMYHQVTSMPVNGISLTKQTNPTTGQGGTLNCGYGGAEQVYVSKRTYTEILADYSQAFQKIGWQQKLILVPDTLENATVFYLPDDMHFIIEMSDDGTNIMTGEVGY